MASIIIVGSNHANTAEYYKRLGLPPSRLVTSTGHNEPVAHTSVQDIFDRTLLKDVLAEADEVYWAESTPDEFPNADWHYAFLVWLKDFHLEYGTVKNLYTVNLDKFGWGTVPKVTANDAVFLGCSVTAGWGLFDPATHYANQISEHFGLNTVNLAMSGGSNGLIFDKFNQLEFVPGQLVVIQLTNLGRLRYCYEDNKLFDLLLNLEEDPKKQRHLLEVYSTNFLFYELLTKIQAIVKRARAEKLRLVFWLIDYRRGYTEDQQSYFYSMPEFVPQSWMQDYQVDYADDGVHPGIESNKQIADTLIRYIERIYK